jgi:hypothetical protein
MMDFMCESEVFNGPTCDRQCRQCAGDMWRAVKALHDIIDANLLEDRLEYTEDMLATMYILTPKQAKCLHQDLRRVR